MSAELWNDVNIDSLKIMNKLRKILIPSDELIQPIDKVSFRLITTSMEKW
jgi:hypothetical protein